jgi:ankyrin repeat protein
MAISFYRAGWLRLIPMGFAVFLAAGTNPAEGGLLPLTDAARSGDKVALRALLQKKADVNATDPDGSTSLHWASYRDDLESAELLIRAGAKVNVANDLGVTPLWPASQNGSSAMVRKLLEAGANPNAALLAGETPLMVAARSGYPDVVEQLLAKGASPNARGTRGQTALMWAVAQKHPDVVRVLLAHHADIQLRSDGWTEVMAVPPHGYLPYNKAIPHGSETALMFAARVGDLDSAKLLVAAGADVNDADAWGVSATTLAAHSGFGHVVAFLLEKSADPNAAPNGFTALHEAIMRRDEKMVNLLLDHHADPNTPLKTWTPTRRSSEDFHFEPSLVGATPFWLAARLLEPTVMRSLAEHGADPLFVLHVSWVGSQGTGQQERTATSTALLAATGVSGDGGNRDSSGVAPWVPIAASEREALTLEAVKVAVELGIDVNATSKEGRTALDGATNLKYKSVVAFLLEKGARPGTAPAQPPPGRGRGRAPEGEPR